MALGFEDLGVGLRGTSWCVRSRMEGMRAGFLRLGDRIRVQVVEGFLNPTSGAVGLRLAPI